MSPTRQARFHFQIFPSSGVPIYRQIMDQVRAHIASGNLKKGEILPSVRVTARELQVNPMTVSKAYSLLEREGVLEFVRGTGMRVRAPTAPEGDSERMERLRPLLEQVANTSHQLSITPEQVLRALESLLKGRTHEE